MAVVDETRRLNCSQQTSVRTCTAILIYHKLCFTSVPCTVPNVPIRLPVFLNGNFQFGFVDFKVAFV